jgi:hypothetical protein
MAKKDPFAELRAMGVTMSVVERQDPPKRPRNRRKATLPSVVNGVRLALLSHQGLSAATIAWVLVPELRDYAEGICAWSGIGNYPHDPDDFSRCRRIVALIPNGVARMAEVAAALPKWRGWAGLAPAWAELEALWLEEEKRADRRMPKLYARIQELTR